ncbi:MAG: carbohydrate ABC transporter substrate-binding protein [Candidatus Hydrogenedentes bacterium]|nr:carbohydrate ABC transporter substrate-binding protein [Candidatus Hydrogenedentota bacterium]
MSAASKFVRSYFPFVVVGGTFAWSVFAIYGHRAVEAPPGTITLRIAHWQLETGVRDAFNELADEYAKLHPNVRIVQDAIPETTYGQWVSTQLMGGTAPDMIEIGYLPPHILVSYYNRYYLTLTRYVDQPNPYNAGTEFEGVPLRLTYKDGMRTGYVEELQEYMNIPLSQFGVRLFYNKDLLKKLTGLDEAPSEYRAFLDVCEQIASQQNELGEYYTPIAGSKFHFAMWESYMFNPFTYGAVRKADFNRDGYVGYDENYVAFSTGRLTFESPWIANKFRMVREITDYFQSGYTGLTRDEAVFLFAQQRAVFITTGTWDALSLADQARGRFEVGLLSFPNPTPDDPVYGEQMEGPLYEYPMQGFAFGITRSCDHPEVALDFLLFLASRHGNERMNRIIGWIPAIRNAEMAPLIAEFTPNIYGMYNAINFNMGGETWIKWLQMYALYQVKQITYEEFAAEFGPFYLERGIEDFRELQKDWRRGIARNEQFLAGVRAKALMADGDEALSHWVKYRALTASRQIWPEVWHNAQVKMMERGPDLDATGPYEYSDEVLERVRQRLRREDRQARAAPAESGRPRGTAGG